MESPQQLYDQLSHKLPSYQYTLNSFFLQGPDGIHQPINRAPFSVDLVATTTAMSASVEHRDKSVEDVYLLTTYFVLTPEIFGVEYDAENIPYRLIEAHQITGYTVQCTAAYLLNKLSDVEKFSDLPILNHDESYILQSSPATTELTTEVTSSVSQIFGANAGVEGAGLAAGFEVSNSKTFAVPDVTISNTTRKDYSTVKFNIALDARLGRDAFQPIVQQVISLKDTKIRPNERCGLSEDPPGIAFLMSVKAEISAFSRGEVIYKMYDFNTWLLPVMMPPLPKLNITNMVQRKVMISNRKAIKVSTIMRLIRKRLIYRVPNR